MIFDQLEMYGNLPYNYNNNGGDVMAQPKPKTERLEARVTPEEKELFLSAMERSGKRSLSEFMISAMLEKAHSILHKHEVIALSRQDQRAFAAALLDSPAPSERLHQAAKHYKKIITP